MSQFMDQLIVEEVRDDTPTLWRLRHPFRYQSDLLGRIITVPEGFVTDFASVPRVPAAYLLAGGEADEAAVIHDYLYQSHETDRPTADAIFEEAMAVSGQPWWRRKLMWAAVRLFGGEPYADDPDQPKGDTP